MSDDNSREELATSTEKQMLGGQQIVFDLAITNCCLALQRILLDEGWLKENGIIISPDTCVLLSSKLGQKMENEARSSAQRQIPDLFTN